MVRFVAKHFSRFVVHRCRQRRRINERRDYVRTNPKFSVRDAYVPDLDAIELSEVVHIMQVQRLRRGQLAFRQGDPGDAWYVLFRARPKCSKRSIWFRVVSVDRQHVLVKWRYSMDRPVPRLSDGEDSTAFRFLRSDFQRLLESSNIAAYKLVYQMALVLASRQRNTTTQDAELLKADCESDIRVFTPIMDEATLSSDDCAVFVAFGDVCDGAVRKFGRPL